MNAEDPMASANPYAGLALGGANIVTNIIGLIMQKQAMDRARKDAQAIDAREVEYRAGRDVVNDRFTKESLKMSKEKLGMDKAALRQAFTKDKIAQIENLFNTNIGLQDRNIRRWGGR